MPEENSQTQNPTQPPVMQQIIAGLLSHLTVDSSVAVIDSFDESQIPDGSGAVTANITSVEQMNVGLPDYSLAVAFYGMTYASVDPDKSIIRSIFGSVMRSIQNFTPSGLADIVPAGAAVVGILPVTSAVIEENEDSFTFNINFKIVVTDLNF